MQAFYLKDSEVNPLINLDPISGNFIISGKSVPENAKDFYEPLLRWLAEYKESPAESTHLIIDLEFFNISSSKVILYILYKMLDIQNKGKEVQVTWRYSDAFLLNAGRDYAVMVKIPFEFIKVSIKEPA